MNILVTGGAGYIGSAAVKKIIQEGHEVIVIDNLSKGKKELVDDKAKFYEGDLINLEFLKNVFSKHKFDAIMHFAGYKAAGESMINLEKYSQNITSMINLLDNMVQFNVKKIIFSSSAAVYGEPQYTPIDESHPLNPINYYGFTKLECERIIDWYSKQKGIVGICLRYFNVMGDAGLNYRDPDAQNIEPIIYEVLSGKREKLLIFGNDYETPDGTCVRDYIDIKDLVHAHTLALNLNSSDIINLGTGKGTSVLEFVKKYNIPYEFSSKREGDPATLTASSKKAKRLLGWIPKEKVIKN
ncbi:UDP-glucose 4-epimerase GalE [archaeon]|jgi:UDP-glucose 4-epimerase|nr:UDP-glucose 4-epimerase GalE [archaeon]MBT3451334.1 UDP-glucose 4-epimerase GalE [archaeon]MBT6869350.1 UDP-glucose 4-epimerase GalE [archaeon]MBT7192513.1 UDP-glucose 4-epimerase GalE [archaeon]MBT7380589.1 UDP-glucose 4-epimerase GalE [archaeon]